MKAGWQTSTLGDVLAVIRNGVNCKQDKSGNGDRISRIESISNATFDLDKVGYAELSERDKEKNRLQPGDILFSHINSAVHVGKTAVFDCDEPVYHGVNLLLMRPKEVVTSAYLDHALKYLFQSGYWRGVCKQSVNQASVNQQDISRVEIRYPKSLAEQQRIVAILDEAFAGLATAKANAEKNLQNARALFESHLQSVFTQRGAGWNEKNLGDVCELFQGLCINAKTKHLLVEKSSLPLLRIKDLRSNSAEQFIAETGWPKNAKVSEDETIYTRTGQIGLVFRGRVGILHNNCFKVKPKPELNNDYLFWWLQNPEFKVRITTLASKAAQPDITHALFKVQPIQIPPRDYQDKMIAVVDEIHKETQRLVGIYKQKLAALDALKQSLLHQAFSGQL